MGQRLSICNNDSIKPWNIKKLPERIAPSNIKKLPERIAKIKYFINQYNREEINFSADTKDWKKFETNNKTIALIFLFLPSNKEEIN